MFGPINNTRNRELPDLSRREIAVFVPVVVMAFVLGLYPAPFLSTIDPAVQRTVTQFQAKFAVTVEDGAMPKMMPDPGAPPAPAPAPAQPTQAAAGTAEAIP
jgi:NADH-quinone oxidoreductase subunit M